MSIGKNSIDLLFTSSPLQISWGSMIHDWRPTLRTRCWLDLGDSRWRMQALQRIFLHMFYFACFWRPDYCKLLQNPIYRRAAFCLCRMWRRKMPSLVFGMHTLQSSQLVTSQKYKHYTWSERRTSQTDSTYFWGNQKISWPSALADFYVASTEGLVLVGFDTWGCQRLCRFKYIWGG